MSSISYPKDETLAKKPKFRKNLLKNIMFFYACLVLATPLSLVIANIYHSEDQAVSRALNILLLLLYSSVTAIIIAVSIYLHINRYQTYEEAGKGNSKTVDIIYSMKGEEVGLYLRFGVVLLCTCSIVFEVLIICQRKFTRECIEADVITKGITKIILFIAQSIFLLKYHSIVILKHTKIIQFCLYSIIFIDITIWEMASISKLSHAVSSTENASKCEEKNIAKAANYFLPTVSEYCVIGAAITYEIMKRLNMPSMIETMEHEEHQSIRQKFERSRTGVIIAAFIVLITTGLTTFMIIKDTIDYLIYIHMGQEILYYAFSIIISIAIFNKNRLLKYSFTFLKNNVDRNLLFLSAFLSIYFSILIFVYCFVINAQSIDLRFRGMTAIMEIIQIMIQTFIIDDSFYRCCDNPVMQKMKPGQNYLAVLIGLNFSLWIIKSFQIKSGDIFFRKDGIGYKESKDHYMMLFIMYATLPLSILYRYHSSSCLADVYSKIYDGEISRFEGVLRAEGFRNLPNSNDEKKSENGYNTLSILSPTAMNHLSDGINSQNPSGSNNGAPRIRSKSLNFIPTSMPLNPLRRRRAKPMTRRETLKNLEAAKLRVLSSHLSQNMVTKKLTASVSPANTLNSHNRDNETSMLSNEKSKNYTGQTISQLVVTDLFNPVHEMKHGDQEIRIARSSTNIEASIKEENEDEEEAIEEW